jgi:MFS family permease
MKPELPQGTRAQRIALARDEYRQRQLGRAKVRMARDRRRWIVAGQVGVVALTLAGQLAVGWNVVPETKALAFLWTLLGVQAVFFLVLMYAVGNLTQLDAVLDERERAQRDHAMALAYRILIVAIGLVALAVLLAATVHRLPIPSTQVGVESYVGELLWFVVGLPLAVMAWTLPDPDPET